MENTTLRRRVLATATATVAVGALALAGLNGVASAGPAGTTAPAVSADSLSPACWPPWNATSDSTQKPRRLG